MRTSNDATEDEKSMRKTEGKQKETKKIMVFGDRRTNRCEVNDKIMWRRPSDEVMSYECR